MFMRDYGHMDKELLKILMEDACVSQSELARRMGMSRSMVSYMLVGKKRIEPGTREKIERALSLPVGSTELLTVDTLQKRDFVDCIIKLASGDKDDLRMRITWFYRATACNLPWEAMNEWEWKKFARDFYKLAADCKESFEKRGEAW